MTGLLPLNPALSPLYLTLSPHFHHFIIIRCTSPACAIHASEWENTVIWARDKRWRRNVRSETWHGRQKIKITVKYSHFRMAESHRVITHLIGVAHAHTAWDCITEIVGKLEYKPLISNESHIAFAQKKNLESHWNEHLLPHNISWVTNRHGNTIGVKGIWYNPDLVICDRVEN